MALFFHDLELDHDFAEERDIAALLAEVGRHIEGELICPNRQRRVYEARDPAVLVGLVGGEQHQVAAIPARERDRDARGRLATLGVEDVGRERWSLIGRHARYLLVT